MAIFVGLWIIVWTYVFFNKKSIVKRVTTELNSRIKGEIKISDLEPSLISTFPHVSLRLSQVIIRDTMWKQHHHDLLKAEKIFIRLGFFSLFSGEPEIKKVIVEKASVYVFSDSTGYTNEYMFSSQDDKAGNGGKSKLQLPDIELKSVRLVMDLQHRSKLYDFDIGRLKCDIKTNQTSLELNVKTDMLVHNLAFNTGNGSFIKEKPLEGKFRVTVDRLMKRLSFKNIVLNIDDHPFRLSGMFDLDEAPPLYYLAINTDNIYFRNASTLVSNNISGKLDSFAIQKPIKINVTIDGRTRPNRIPLVNLEVVVKNNNIGTPIGEFTEASFVGKFSNQLLKEERRVDKNSGFSFTSFSGKWEGVPLKSDTINITNLEHPVLECDLRSSFKLNTANDLLGSSTIDFIKGHCDVDVRYRGLILEGDTAEASIHGNVVLKDAAIRYVPRNLLLSNCSGKLVFEDKDVYVKQLKASAGNSQLIMNGEIKNLVSLIDKNPEKLLLNWNITSQKLNLGDFVTFLGKRSAGSDRSSKRKMLKFAKQIDRMLQDCNVDLQLNAERLIYKKFDATNVAARIRLSDRLVSIRDVLVQHSGGTLTLNGSMLEEAVHNSIKLHADMENVDVAKIFTAFNNFGQDGVTDKNLGGRLYAQVDVTGYITNKATIVENSLKGIIDIRLKNGELNNFEPVEKISQTAFKKRDFSHVRFAELKDRLQVNGSEIKVNRMEIQSSVLTMFVEGIYDIKKGTDLSIQIPLNNLTKDEKDYNLKNKGINKKNGVSLRLRARTGDDGKAKISWDPFNLALKKKDNVKPDSSSTMVKESTQLKSKQ